MTEVVQATVVEDLFAEDQTPVALAKPDSPSLARIRGIEDEMQERSLGIIDGVLAFADLPLEATEAPPEWVAQYGKEGAAKRFRLARHGMESAKDAPVAIKVAVSVHAAITKARATEKAGPKSLNIQFVQMSAPLPDFPVIEVDSK